MSRRLYFLFGDLLATSVTGALCGLAAAAVVAPSWNPWLAMLAGMAAGMVICLPAAFVFMPLFGAMEIMMPVMLTGMMATMVVAMEAAMEDLTPAAAAQRGALVGVGVLLLLYAADRFLRTRGHRWTR